VAILAEAGRPRWPGALYGVWAARSGGAGARLVASGHGLRLCGTVRFCSGARTIDRALVVADAPEREGGHVLVEVAVAQPGVVPEPDTWATPAMATADTVDVRFDDVPVPTDAVVGEAGWYTARPGFLVGGGGVAAVWWGGAAGVLDRAIGHLPPHPDPHQLAHLGELHALVEAASALLSRTAGALDAAPAADHAHSLAEVRCVVERAAREVVERVPRMVGTAPLSRDGNLARALADLSLYIRQHHGERDHAALGASVLAMRAAR
jgi:alkylation response protein AidB-like acyl-CoA dehydrogenase